LCPTLTHEVKKIKNQLGLEVNELLSTLIIGIIETKECKAELLVIGDGLICWDGQLFEFGQNDKPDYLGYHLSHNFSSWYESQKQHLTIDQFKDLSICTDGIFTFKNFENPSNQKTEGEIVKYLLRDTEGYELDQFLDNKILYLKNQSRHFVTDDLAIIRIITTA